MTFEEWWEENGHDNYYGDHTKQITKYAWNAATAAERKRCREIVDDLGRYGDIVEMLERIGE